MTVEFSGNHGFRTQDGATPTKRDAFSAQARSQRDTLWRGNRKLLPRTPHPAKQEKWRERTTKENERNEDRGLAFEEVGSRREYVGKNWVRDGEEETGRLLGK